MDRYEAKRKRMVDEHVMKMGVTDQRVLEVMRRLPRHIFVEPALAHRAYDDWAGPIGSGQTISQPYMVGMLAQHAQLTGAEKVLEIGTGSGYQTSVLASLSDTVFTIERFNSLSNGARKIFNELNFKNIVCIVGDGSVGAPSHAPFDAIVVTAGSPQIPEPLALQLTEGGRMVIPVGDGGEQ
ncbi:MAG: protein-L-isoaspartate(D-aspartate) O-methyltransferase, partial [Nitrospinota bacterium]|nr:protein-L-isoaspartate(D-aspartate) O-methyltransferase [Nitrospinota bacterium]